MVAGYERCRIEAAREQGAEPQATQQRPAITRECLTNLATFFAHEGRAGSVQSVIMRAVVLVAYHGCFRASEYLDSGAPEKLLRRRDVQLLRSEQGGLPLVEWTIRNSKANQLGPPEIVVLHPCPAGSVDEVLCPGRAVLAFMDWRQLRTRDPESAFFLWPGKGAQEERGLSPEKAASGLRGVLRVLAEPLAETFSLHSLRIGAADEAVARGATYEELKALGRWRSGA